MEIKQYNKKGFLLPDSIKSMAAYHAKIMPEGNYMFRIHDCLSGVRLQGDLNNTQDICEAVDAGVFISIKRNAKVSSSDLSGTNAKVTKEETLRCAASNATLRH